VFFVIHLFDLRYQLSLVLTVLYGHGKVIRSLLLMDDSQ